MIKVFGLIQRMILIAKNCWNPRWNAVLWSICRWLILFPLLCGIVICLGFAVALKQVWIDRQVHITNAANLLNQAELFVRFVIRKGEIWLPYLRGNLQGFGIRISRISTYIQNIDSIQHGNGELILLAQWRKWALKFRGAYGCLKDQGTQPESE